MKLQTKFSLAVVGLLAAAIGSVSGLMLVYQRQNLVKEVDRQNSDMVQRLARVSEESLYQSDVIVLNYLKEIAKERGVTAAFVTNAAGEVIAHTDASKIGAMAVLDPAIKPDNRNVSVNKLDVEGHPTLVYSHNVYFGSSVAGTAHVFIDRAQLDAYIHSTLRQVMWPLMIISGIVLLLGIAGALIVAKTLIHPIEVVVGGMRAIAKGSLSPLPSLRRSDELGWMADELNVMAVKLKELDEMKQEFISSVTHELRSPLTAIDRFASLLLQEFYGPLLPEQKESLITVKNNTIRLTNFIDDVLTSAHIEKHRLDMYVETFDVSEVVHAVYSLFTPIAIEKKLEFKMDLPAAPIVATLDRIKVIHILTNLVSNAFKFTSAGSVMLKARTIGTTVELDVIDTGAGIPDADKQRLFERFFRSSATARAHSGTGLGLAIVKGLVELHDGHVHVLDRPGGGSIFRVVIPANKTGPQGAGENVALKSI